MFNADFCEKDCPICTRARKGNRTARLLQRIEMLVTFGGCPSGRARQRKYGVPPSEPLPAVPQVAGERGDTARAPHEVLDLSMRHSPRVRRVLVRCGLGLSLLIALARIAMIPWSWRYVPDSTIWFLFVLVFIPSLLLMWHERRWVFPPHCCHKCGYVLTGNSSGVCPECGTSVASGSTAAVR
jgi:hypothetical protein